MGSVEELDHVQFGQVLVWVFNFHCLQLLQYAGLLSRHRSTIYTRRCPSPKVLVEMSEEHFTAFRLTSSTKMSLIVRIIVNCGVGFFQGKPEDIL